MKLILGIDPGLDGACAVIQDGAAFVWDTPTTQETMASGKHQRHVDGAGIAAELRGGMLDAVAVEAVIEHVWSSPQQGVRSAFTMGEGLGVWLGVLAALGIPVRWVTPRAWKKAVGLQVGADKEASRAVALRLFPACAQALSRKKDHGRAEALLIGWWATHA